MKSWTAALTALAVTSVALGLLAIETGAARKNGAEANPSSAIADDVGKGKPDADSPEQPKADNDTDEVSPPGKAATENEAESLTAERYFLLPDGSPVPALPASAPTRIRLGVALFRYKGAQGASSGSRTRDEALGLAEQSLGDAAEDFGEIVKKADPGSSIDVGWVGRGVLEPGVEHEVFALAKGAIRSEPLDTPRGFWVVRRVK